MLKEQSENLQPRSKVKPFPADSHYNNHTILIFTVALDNIHHRSTTGLWSWLMKEKGRRIEFIVTEGFPKS